MAVKIEKSEGIQRHLLISVDAKKVDEAFDKKLNETAKQVRLDGFRPGKVPVKVVKQRFEKPIRQELAQGLIEENLEPAFKEADLKVAGIINIEIDSNESGKDFSFKAVVEVFPEIELKDLDKIEAEKLNATVKEDDVKTMLENLQKQRASWKAVEREVKDGYRVEIDFIGKIDGEVFEGGSAEKFHVMMGSNQMIEGFESGLLGKKAGEQCVLDLTFPKDYQKAELAGKPVKFDITINEVAESELPEFNDEFAKNFNVDSADKLKAEIKDNMTRELEFNLKNKLKSQLFDGLIKYNSIEVPAALTQQEVQVVKQQTAQQFGMTQKDQWKSLPDQLFMEQAKKRVMLALLVGKIVDENDIKADEESVNKMLEKMTSVYEDSKSAIAEFKANSSRMAEIEQAVIEDKVVEKLLEAAKITEKTVDFKTAMVPPSQHNDDADESNNSSDSDNKPKKTAKKAAPSSKPKASTKKSED